MLIMILIRDDDDIPVVPEENNILQIFSELQRTSEKLSSSSSLSFLS